MRSGGMEGPVYARIYNFKKRKRKKGRKGREEE